jgi:hypothetical protein
VNGIYEAASERLHRRSGEPPVSSDETLEIYAFMVCFWSISDMNRGFL